MPTPSTYSVLYWWFAQGRDRSYSTLSGIPSFQSGVGRAGDLEVRVREDLEGRWFPVLHTGYYYIGTEELYLYADRGEYSFTTTTTGTLGSFAVSGLTIDPTTLGPVILYRVDYPRPIQRVCSPLRAFRPLSFSGSDELKSATVPGLLVSLLTDPVTGIYLSVPATGSIVANTDYVYDPQTGLVQIRDSAPPPLYATYLVDETDPDLLRQEEILIVDSDGRVRTQYAPVSMASGFVPIIRRPTSAGTIQATGVSVNRNAISFTPSGQIPSGSMVAVQYYVDDSFTAIPSGTFMVVHHFLATAGLHSLEFERSEEDWYDISRLDPSHANYVQLNPILDPRQSGFLFLIDSHAGYPTPRRVRLTASNPNPIYNPSGSAGLIITATVLDAEDEPVPQQGITTTVSGVAGALNLVYQAEAKGNGLGQVVYAFTPASTGRMTVVSTTDLGGASGILELMIRPWETYAGGIEPRLGKLLLHLEETPFRDDLFRLNAYYCYPDGAPYQEDSSTETWTTSVTFTSSHSPFFNLDGVSITKPASISLDADSVASILIRPIPDDVIRASVQTPVAGRLRTAPPIRIPPTEEQED